MVCLWILLGLYWYCWQMLSHLMLFFVLADVIAIFCMFFFCDRSYCHNLGRWYCLWLLTCGWCCYHIGVFNISCWDLADVIANAFFFFFFFLWQILLPLFVCWQILLPYMWKMVNHISCVYISGRCCCHGGRWNSHLRWVMIGRCYCHSDWCYCHWSAISILVLRCSAEPHPICVADGICLHSC